MKYACIKENSCGLSILKCCRLLSVSKSGYYDWLKLENSAKADELGLKVVEIFHEFKRRYGSIRIRNELKKLGIEISRKRTRKAMKKYGLTAKATKKCIVSTNSKLIYQFLQT